MESLIQANASQSLENQKKEIGPEDTARGPAKAAHIQQYAQK